MPDSLDALLRSATVVDLTHTLTPDFPLYPGYDPVLVREKFSVEEDGFFVQSWSFDEHCGTHVDAPAHFGGEDTIERIDPADLLLPIVLLDVRERITGDDDAMVGPDDLRSWRRDHGDLPERCLLLALTGWGGRAGDPDAYLNADADGVLHSPGFSPELTDLLKDEHPGVRGIGVDTTSLDIGASTDFPAHLSWLPSGRYGIENLANLERVPPAGAFAFVGAPRLLGGSGGPTRVLALVP